MRWVLDQSLILLHPFMPFVTEELWALTADASQVKRDKLLCHAAWPQDGVRAEDAAAEINFVVETIKTIFTEKKVTILYMETMETINFVGEITTTY